MMKDPEEKTMKEVEIDVTLSAKPNQPLNLEKRLNFLINLPIMVYIEKGNKLIANFEGESVTIRPEKDGASYANYKGIRGCTVELENNHPAKVYNKNLCGGTSYYFHTHSKGS